MSIFKGIFREIFNKEQPQEETPINEGIFDTDVFKEYTNKYKNMDLSDVSSERKEQIDTLLAYPCALPFIEDGTLEAWLLRISLWGKIKITWKNPEDKINKTVNNLEFLKHVDDQKSIDAYGTWNVEEVDIDKIRFYREYWGLDGKNNVEELIVDIDLREDLKKKLRQIGRI